MGSQVDDSGAARTKGRLEALAPGQAIPFGGDRAAYVSPELAAAFRAGDRLVVVQDTGDLLHIPAREHANAEGAVSRASAAFARMGEVSDTAITAFFEAFAAKLDDEAVWAAIAAANAADVESARARGRSTTRLLASDAMRRDMIAGLRAWRDAEAPRGRVLERVEHPGWSVEQVMAPLGVVGFVFEGRPNVFADATGVIRAGNTVVFRIGSDALGTARAIVTNALDPALAEAGLPDGAAVLVDSAAHAAGWAMFSDSRLALAVARGSGPAVAQLGAIARQAGTPVSLHGTGGAWMVADATADTERFYATAFHSLDRKVCNTLNVCCIVRERADELVPVFLEALERAGERRKGCKLHVAEADFDRLPQAWRTARATVIRAEGPVEEALCEPIADADLGREWEWEETPEVSLKVVDDVAQAVALFNAFSPHFAASLISQDPAAHARFYETIDAPFVGDGFTRWVDGQYALDRPELGLSNWENGRLFARGGVLAGDGVFTVRARVRQDDLDLDRGGASTPPRARQPPRMWFAGPARRAPVGGRPQALRLGFHLARGMKVGLYGGSFNPAHDGHAHVAETAKRRLGLDRVIWLVSPQNPLKSSRETADLDERIAGAKALTQGIGMIVVGAETKLGSTYTIDTIRSLKARFPGVHFVWIMGADSLASFHRWKGWTQIMHEAPVAVVSRPWISLKSRFSPATRRFARFRRPTHAAMQLPGSRTPAWVFLFGRFNFQSSTALRERQRRSRDPS